MYGPTSESEGICTIHAAIDAGITLLDTGDFYGTGHNELLICRAIADRRDKVQLSVKFGALRGPDGAWLGYDCRPASVKNAVVERFGAYARDLRVTPAQLALAWVRAKAPRYLPLVGARTVEQLHDALAALSLSLSAAQLAELDAIVNPTLIQGTRYAAQHMAMLDSEK
jgi:aryl-alcohol dehydrogenase-like predicted oxidoreductase